MHLQDQGDSTWRWLVSTRPWIIQIRSWGTITTPSLCDFAHHAAKEDTNFENSAEKTMDIHRRPTRHVHLCSHTFDQQNHTTASLVRPCNSVPVMRSQNHWYHVNSKTDLKTNGETNTFLNCFFVLLVPSLKILKTPTVIFMYWQTSIIRQSIMHLFPVAGQNTHPELASSRTKLEYCSYQRPTMSPNPSSLFSFSVPVCHLFCGGKFWQFVAVTTWNFKV